MEIKDILKQEFSHVELYLAKKTKYNKESKDYFFDRDSLVSLDLYNPNSNFSDLFNNVREYLNTYLSTIDTLQEYTTKDCEAHFLTVDNSIDLDYQESLVKQLCSIALIESESVSFNYLLFKAITHDNEDFMIWIKLKSPVKVVEQQFLNNTNSFTLSIQEDKIVSNNYFNFDFDIENIAFMYYKKEFYIIDSSLYQNYFNLKTLSFLQAENIVYNSDCLINDGEILTKQNAKLIKDYFENVEIFINEIDNDNISRQEVSKMIDILNLSMTYQEEDNKFLLRKPSDLKDLILLASGCLGINKLTDNQYRVKKPNFLEE